MKKTYDAPTAKVVKFEKADVIMASGCDKEWDDVYAEWVYYD